jgi:hypothetical protein
MTGSGAGSLERPGRGEQPGEKRGEGEAGVQRPEGAP